MVAVAVVVEEGGEVVAAETAATLVAVVTARGCGACSFVLKVSAELQGIQISSRTRSALCNAIRVLRVGASMPAEKVGCLCLRRVFFLRVH